MELVQDTFTVSRTVCRGSTQTMSGGDIIVPDTKADILKIVQVDADAHITERSINGGRLTLSGRTELKILYIPDSDRDKICSIISSFDFSQEISCKNADDDMQVMAAANVSRAEFSVINSRKLHIKAIIALDYEVTETRDASIATDADEDSGIQTRRETLNLQNAADICDHSFAVQENIELSNGQPPVKELLKTDVQITDTEYKTVTGRIILKGMLDICLLYISDEGNIEHSETALPFTEVVDSALVGDDCVCVTEYAVSGTDCAVSEDSDGERRVIDAEVRICVQIKATEGEAVEMVTDCYMPYKHTELTREPLELEEIIASPSSQNTLKDIVEFPPGVPSVKSVYNVVMKPYLTKTEAQGGRLLCEGKIEAYVLYLSDSAENPVYSVRREIPFGYVLNYDDASPDLTANVRAQIRHSGYNLNSAGEVELRCILSLEANIIRRRREEIITDVEISDIAADEDRGIVIYFVQAGDTLWDIAKRYAVSVAGIMQYNEIADGDKLKPGDRLFIPV